VSTLQHSVAKRREVFESVGFTTRSAKRLRARQRRARRLPNERKIPVRPWTIRENRIIAGSDAASLSEGYPMRALQLQLPRARHLLRVEQRRALELLGSIPHGVAEDLLVLAHGFDSDMIAGLVHTVLATARRETVKAGGPPIEVVRIMIADIGLRAIEGLTERRPSPCPP
jgi:hypothetical protein